MKLRNKKTGEILEDTDILGLMASAKNDFPIYRSLAELNEEWEDYEESKELYWINYDGSISHTGEGTMSFKNQKQIGNYFETKKEAKKAVEKLKAWKRLKEAGAEFYGWRRNQTGTYELYMRWYDRIPRSYEVKKDLDRLFGGEE